LEVDTALNRDDMHFMFPSLAFFVGFLTLPRLHRIEAQFYNGWKGNKNEILVLKSLVKSKTTVLFVLTEF
jgi:hypothetical protein